MSAMPSEQVQHISLRTFGSYFDEKFSIKLQTVMKH